jgi:hypothetical protein
MATNLRRPRRTQRQLRPDVHVEEVTTASHGLCCLGRRQRKPRRQGSLVIAPHHRTDRFIVSRAREYQISRLIASVSRDSRTVSD